MFDRNSNPIRFPQSVGSADRIRAEKLLASFEAIHQLMQPFCDQMRQKVDSHGVSRAAVSRSFDEIGIGRAPYPG